MEKRTAPYNSMKLPNIRPLPAGSLFPLAMQQLVQHDEKDHHIFMDIHLVSSMGLS